jgi:hypothetical protein
VPQPDITVVVPRRDYYERAHPEPRDVLLVVEVASTTLAFDRDVKRMYARSGVVELWIVDVNGRLVTRLHSPRDGVYAASPRPKSASRSRWARFTMFGSTCRRSSRADSMLDSFPALLSRIPAHFAHAEMLAFGRASSGDDRECRVARGNSRAVIA